MSIRLVAATVLIALVATWPLFILLDRASVRQITRHGDLDEDDAEPLGVFVGVVRTIALLVSLVAVPVAVLIASMVPIVVAVSVIDDSTAGTKIAVSLAVGAVELTLLRQGLTYIFEQGLLRLMNLDSPNERGWEPKRPMPSKVGLGLRLR